MHKCMIFESNLFIYSDIPRIFNMAAVVKFLLEIFYMICQGTRTIFREDIEFRNILPYLTNGTILRLMATLIYVHGNVIETFAMNGSTNRIFTYNNYKYAHNPLAERE